MFGRLFLMLIASRICRRFFSVIFVYDFHVINEDFEFISVVAMCYNYMLFYGISIGKVIFKMMEEDCCCMTVLT